MDVSEDVGDVEFHIEETCLGVVDRMIGGSQLEGRSGCAEYVDNYPGISIR